MKTIRLIVLIFNFSYFIGMSWFIICQIINDLQPGSDNFISHYKLDDEMPDMKVNNAIKAVYFAFTSLSTVGLGDFCPRSDIERILVAAMLLFGVAIFSFIMGNFIEMFNQIISYNDTLDEGDKLAKFFGVIERFNNNKPFNLELKRKIEEHFDYKWQNDKNAALTQKEDRDILMQIPEQT